MSLRSMDLARADRVILSFSDIEMGAGGPTDDFPNTAWLSELFLAYNHGPTAVLPIDLVFNGDTFDLLKTPVDGRYEHLVDEELAVAKLRRVVAAHPAFFEGIRRFLDGPDERRVHFVVGNHDFELLFPAVQDELRRVIGRDVNFPGFTLDIGDVRIEHGSQLDPLFRVDPEAPFIEWKGKKILNLPWAAVALVDVAMPLHDLLYPCDRVRPHQRALELLPEVNQLLLERYWAYWTRDWLGAWWSASDPMKHVSWTMFRQIAARLQSGDSSVQLDPVRERASAAERGALVLGHLHMPAWQHVGQTRIIRTGCMRDEFAIEPDGRVGSVSSKVFAELLQRDGRVFRSRLIEVDLPELTAAAMPPSLNDVLEPVRALGTASSEAEQARQLAAEAARRGDPR